MTTHTFGSGWATFTVTVEPKKSITVQRDNEKPVTFRIGDLCEESSYNLIYTGVVKGITEKNVIVEKEFAYKGKTRRMSLENFAWRNWDFDAAEVAQKNFETSQWI